MSSFYFIFSYSNFYQFFVLHFVSLGRPEINVLFVYVHTLYFDLGKEKKIEEIFIFISFAFLFLFYSSQFFFL